MTTIKQLENQRKKEIQSLESSEINSYIDSLVKKMTDSYLKFDVEGMKDLNNKIDELCELVGHKVNNLNSYVTYTKVQNLLDVVNLFRVKELLLDVYRNIVKVKEYNYNVFHDSLVLTYLLRTVLDVYHETESDSIKKFDFVIGIVYRNLIHNLKIFESSLNSIEGYNEGVIMFLEGYKESIVDNPFIKETNLIESYDIMLEDMKELVDNKEKYLTDLKYKFQWLEEDNLFDDYSFERFYDYLFEKYPFMLELDEDSEEYKEKSKDVSKGLLEPFMMKEPQYILSKNECRFVLPSEVEDLTDSMKKIIKEVEEVGYTEFKFLCSSEV